jgi:peptidoglycan/LPS O-acetylase OafA/YrhL
MKTLSQPAESAVQSPSMKYNRALDGLRAIAVMVVLLLHTAHRLPVPKGGGDAVLYFLLRFGWIGVDIFFVLSGFLITGILLSQKHTLPRDYFTVFYARRVLRIFPLYFAVVIGGLLIIHFTEHMGGLVDWVTLLTYTQNFVWIFRPSNVSIWLGHTWSLAVEEQFYIVWPVLVYFVSVRYLKAGIPVAVVLALLLRIALASFNLKRAILISAPTRCDSLLLGALLAIICRGEDGVFGLPPRAGRFLGWLGSVSIVIVLAVGVYNRDLYDETAFNRTFGFLLMAFVALGLISACLQGGWLARVLSFRPLVNMGRVSYGIYLFHPPILTLLSLAMFHGASPLPYPVEALLLFGIGATITVAVSTLSYNYFESRVLGYKRYFEYPRPIETEPVAPVS